MPLIPANEFCESRSISPGWKHISLTRQTGQRSRYAAGSSWVPPSFLFVFGKCDVPITPMTVAEHPAQPRHLLSYYCLLAMLPRDADGNMDAHGACILMHALLHVGQSQNYDVLQGTVLRISIMICSQGPRKPPRHRTPPRLRTPPPRTTRSGEKSPRAN